MVRFTLIFVVAALTVPTPVWPAEPAAPISAGSVSFTDDLVLKNLVRQAIAARPELRQGRALIQAERERVPQARTLPDPSVSVGIQNDGFGGLQIGKMETSWWSVGAAQSFPWFGKRDLRVSVAELQARNAEAGLGRALLTVQAEAERAYLDMLEIRDEKDLLTRMEALWVQSESTARSRYESGDGVQSDLLRAQLARNRLRQRRLTVEAEETRRLLVINRLRATPASETLDIPTHLVDLADPVLSDLATAIADARRRSPELLASALEQEQAERQIAVVRRDAYPDVTVNAAIMPRGGPFVTMWQAGVSVNVPVWTAAKRGHEVAEIRARAEAAAANAEAIRCLLEQRVRERHALLTALVESSRIYRSGLLVQSEATVASTLAQYRVGKVPMAAVLDAMTGYVSDVSGYLQSATQAQRLAIAEREVSLAEAGGTPSGMSGGSSGANEAKGMGASAAMTAGSSREPGGAASAADTNNAGATGSTSKM